VPKSSSSSLVSAKFRGNSANSNGSTLGNDSAKSSSSHAQSKSSSADLYTDLTANDSADYEEDKSMNISSSAKSSKSAKSSSVAQGRSNSAKSSSVPQGRSDSAKSSSVARGRSNSAKSNANDSAKSDEETWKDLNNLEVQYGMTKHIKKEPTDKDRERLFTFIEHSNDPDDRSLANIWLQKFDHWEEKALLAPKPRAKSSRMKPSSQIQASAKSVNKEKLSLPRSEDPKAGFSFSVEELPSMDHVPAKDLN
jgi:hypothetical protein